MSADPSVRFLIQVFIYSHQPLAEEKWMIWIMEVMAKIFTACVGGEKCSQPRSTVYGKILFYLKMSPCGD